MVCPQARRIFSSWVTIDKRGPSSWLVRTRFLCSKAGAIECDSFLPPNPSALYYMQTLKNTLHHNSHETDVIILATLDYLCDQHRLASESMVHLSICCHTLPIRTVVGLCPCATNVAVIVDKPGFGRITWMQTRPCLVLPPIASPPSCHTTTAQQCYTIEICAQWSNANR